jgi:hypothetical protein
MPDRERGLAQPSVRAALAILTVAGFVLALGGVSLVLAALSLVVTR